MPESVQMRFERFQDVVSGYLRGRPEGATWSELRSALGLPYVRPCPTWVYRMEQEIGLERSRGPNGMVWRLGPSRRRSHS